MSQDAPGGWAYSRTGAACRPRTDTGVAAVCPAPGRGGQSAPPGSVVSADGARRSAAPLLAALGLAGARVGAGRTAGALRTVTADPRVGGLPTHGWSTTFEVAGDGSLAAAAGRLTRPVRGAVYRVVDARRALAELSDGPAGRCHTVHPGAGAAAGADPADPGGPARPGPLPCVPAGAGPAQVRAAEFGLSAHYVAGRAALVPSWLFQVVPAGGGQPAWVAQPAVDPGSVAATPAPTGQATPAPGSAGAPARARVDSYAADGATLALRFWGGLCSEYSASVVRQSADAVTVQVTHRPRHPGQLCPMSAQQYTGRVRLAAPLGGAAVVYDAATGEPVPRR